MTSNIDPEVGCIIPAPGQWPIAPQEDVPIAERRLWIDGCFDFFHHGHAGVMLQSRRFGDELLVGLHNDEDIAANKGPTVMNLAERVAAVNACRFSTLCVPHAPYVTSIPWISHYGCRYVTHGDDITSDASGNDCYRFVKKAGRMKIVPRTPGISTTDLVGRMLACSTEHFIGSLKECIEGREVGTEGDRQESGTQMLQRLKEYAAAPNGLDPYVQVYTFEADSDKVNLGGDFSSIVSGVPPQPKQRVVYVDGGFDLFSSGHIAFLETVTKMETELATEQGWYDEAARQERLEQAGSDYEPFFIVAGVHDDKTINKNRGINYPIMNIFERGLCVVQCAYVRGVVFNAPVTPSRQYLEAVGRTFGRPLDAVYHGPTAFMPIVPIDNYADAKVMGIFVETPEHDFQDVNAAQIVQRILDRRDEYEERQRKKGVKKIGEEAAHRREKLEEEAEAERLQKIEAASKVVEQ